jgi:voltage-gated potassium channel
MGLVVALLAVVPIAGTTGYVTITDCSVLDGLYMTVITVATVGFREVVPLGPDGQIFTVFLILLGVTTVGFAFTTVTSFVIEGHIRDIVRGRRMDRRIGRMEDHYVVCGMGRIGRGVVREFIRVQVPFVVIEDDESSLEPVDGEAYPTIIGDATEDTVLKQAGIERARGVVAVLPDDASNVYVTLTARELCPNLTIVARASDERSISKLKKAGADRVVSPYELGGTRMAYLLLHPTVVDFVDVVVQGGGEVSLRLEEVSVSAAALVAGNTIRECRIGEKTGAMILAVKDANDKTHFNPGADRVMVAGERLIALGDERQLAMLRVLASGSEVIEL